MSNDGNFDDAERIAGSLAKIARTSNELTSRWLDSRPAHRRCECCGVGRVEPQMTLSGIETIACRDCGHHVKVPDALRAPVPPVTADQVAARLDAEIQACRRDETRLRDAGDTGKADHVAQWIARLLEAKADLDRSR